ncbi:putative transmembrane protein [Sesbania bispinosa]|nr:putative transmembrane protein [Sesbania bispinosa]
MFSFMRGLQSPSAFTQSPAMSCRSFTGTPLFRLPPTASHSAADPSFRLSLFQNASLKASPVSVQIHRCSSPVFVARSSSPISLVALIWQFLYHWTDF